MRPIICHPAGVHDGGGEPLADILAGGSGYWYATGLTHGLRQLGPRTELVYRMTGRIERLTVRGIGGATVAAPTSWGGNGAADIAAIMAVARALGQESGRLGSAIAGILPRGPGGPTAVSRLVAHCALPSPICEGEPMGVYLQCDPSDPGRHRLADAWARLLMRIGEARHLDPASQEWRAWLETQGPRSHRHGMATYRAGGAEGEAGAVCRFFKHIQHIDLSQAYGSILEASELRRCGVVLRPSGYCRPGGDVTGLIPGSLDVPDVGPPRRWDPATEPDPRCQVETRPAPRLTAAVHRILATARSEGGKAGFRAAGRILYGMLHGSTVGISWPRLADAPPGVHRTLAGRACVIRPRALPPFAEPASAYQVLDTCRGEVERVAARLRSLGHTIIGADTDGLIVGGPRPPIDDVGPAPGWARWGVKWSGHLAWSGPRHYVHSGAVVWAGAETGGHTWTRLHSALVECLEEAR